MKRATKREEHVRKIRAAMRGGAGSPDLASILGLIQPEDLAEIMADLDPGERIAVFNHLDLKTAGIVLDDTDPLTTKDLLDNIDERLMAHVLGRMPADEAADAIAEVEPERAQELFARMPPEESEEIRDILQYPEDSAGGIMSPVLVTVEDSMTVDAAIEQLRESDIEEEYYYIYVLDREGVLIGVVPLRRLLTAQRGTPIREIMERKVVKSRVDTDQEEVAGLVRKYDLPALPVVDAEGRLVGRVTADDAIDVITEEATEDIYHLAGLSEEDRVFTSARVSVRKRLPWMLLNLATAFTAGAVIGLFENTLEQLVSLAVFLPVVAGVAGNGGIQALTVITRAIALGEIEFSSGLRVVGKEIQVGLVVGVAAGLLSGLIAYLWHGNPIVGLVLLLAMVSTMTVAGLLGAGIPLILKALGQDPALGSGVLLTFCTDAIGFFSFLGIATLLISRLAV